MTKPDSASSLRILAPTRLPSNVNAVIPFVWLAAMGFARTHEPPPVIALAAGVLCLMVVATGGVDARALRPTPRALAIGGIAALVTIAATYAGFRMVAAAFPQLREATAGLYSGMVGSSSPWVTVLLIVPLVSAEEFLWRGAFQELVAWHLRSRPLVVAVSGLVYGLAVLPYGSLLLVGVGIVCGVVWSALRCWTRSLVAPLVAHIAWDVMLVLVPLTALPALRIG